MIVLVALGCGGSDLRPTVRVMVPIHSEDDLRAAEVLAVEPETSLELVIDAGIYTRGLQLDRDGPVDLVVRGVGEVRFVDAAVALRGRDVAVSGITFVGHPVSYALSVEARRSAVLEDVRLVGFRPFEAPHQTVGLIGLVAGGPGVDARVSRLQVVDSGFPEAVVVQVQSQSGSDWSRLTLDGGEAAEWVGSALLSVEARVAAVDVRGGSWVLPPGAVLVRALVPTRASLSGNRIVLDDAAALGSIVAVEGGTFFARRGPSVRGIASTPGGDEENRAVAARIRAR